VRRPVNLSDDTHRAPGAQGEGEPGTEYGQNPRDQRHAGSVDGGFRSQVLGEAYYPAH
jgi:hypothetical protein